MITAYDYTPVVNCVALQQELRSFPSLIGKQLQTLEICLLLWSPLPITRENIANLGYQNYVNTHWLGSDLLDRHDILFIMFIDQSGIINLAATARISKILGLRMYNWKKQMHAEIMHIKYKE